MATTIQPTLDLRLLRTTAIVVVIVLLFLAGLALGLRGSAVEQNGHHEAPGMLWPASA
jgi:hypothetical protein